MNCRIIAQWPKQAPQTELACSYRNRCTAVCEMNLPILGGSVRKLHDLPAGGKNRGCRCHLAGRNRVNDNRVPGWNQLGNALAGTSIVPMSFIPFFMSTSKMVRLHSVSLPLMMTLVNEPVSW